MYTPLNPKFYIEKMGFANFAGFFPIFLIFYPKYRLCVLERVPQSIF